MTTQIRSNYGSNNFVKKLFRKDWFIISGLLFLSLVPTAAGAMRLTELASGAEITSENASFLLDMIRLFFGVLMLYAIVWALVTIRRRDFKGHEAWMFRGYAIGLGAGTQVFTHLPWFIFFGPEPPGDLSGAVMMAGGWLINLIFVEWLIWKRPFRPQRSLSK